MTARRLLPFLFLLLAAAALPAWETALAGVLTTPPAEGPDGRIYCTAEDRALHALNGTTGKEYWYYRPGRKLSEFTVVSPDGTIFVHTVQNHLVAVSPGGRERWRYRLPSPPALPPAVDSRGICYILTDENRLISLDRLGNPGWEISLAGEYRGIYAAGSRILLHKSGGFDLYTLSGEPAGSAEARADRLVLTGGRLYWDAGGGDWFLLEPDGPSVEQAENPLGGSFRYPDEHVLITSENRIVSGRNDWFMEALQAGAESFHSLYQTGCNPGRSRGEWSLPDSAVRRALYEDTGIHNGIVMLSAVDPVYLNSVLSLYEQAGSYQELVSRAPYYDLQLHDILTDSNVVTMDPHRPSLDLYSRYRIYGILTRWGDLQCRDILLSLTEIEENPRNTDLLLTGLGRIGSDPDGRSMAAVQGAVRHRRADDQLYRAAAAASAELARYNGGSAIRDMMELFTYIENRPVSGRTRDLLRALMRSF